MIIQKWILKINNKEIDNIFSLDAKAFLKLVEQNSQENTVFQLIKRFSRDKNEPLEEGNTETVYATYQVEKDLKNSAKLQSFIDKFNKKLLMRKQNPQIVEACETANPDTPDDLLEFYKV